MRLPDAERGEAEVEMLTGPPGAVLEVEVQPDQTILFPSAEVAESGSCAAEAEAACASFTESGVDEQRPEQAQALVQEEDDDARVHPEGELVPMAPAGA